jgi:hypothetical protein
MLKTFTLKFIFCISFFLTYLNADNNININLTYSNTNILSTESVYSTTGSKVSELVWNTPSIGLLGFDIESLLSNKFLVGGKLKIKYDNTQSGLSNYNFNSDGSQSTNWTLYNNTFIDKIQTYDIYLKYAAWFFKKTILYAQVGYKRDFLSWYAKTPYDEYSSLKLSNTIDTPKDSKAISYEQDISSIYFGAGIIKMFTPHIKFDGNFKYSNSVTILAQDTHHLKDDYGADYVLFEDNLKDGTLKDIELNLFYIFNQKLSFSIGYNYTNYTKTLGYTDTTFIGIDKKLTSNNGTAGASSTIKSYTTSLQYSF